GACGRGRGGELGPVGLAGRRGRAGARPLGLVEARAGGGDEAGAFERFARLSGEPCCVAGLDGCIVAVNPAWEAVLGYRPEELAGQPLARWIGADDPRRARRAPRRPRPGGGAPVAAGLPPPPRGVRRP